MAFIFALQSFETLCSNAERVADGEADAAGPDVQAENAVGSASAIAGHGTIIGGFRENSGR